MKSTLMLGIVLVMYATAVILTIQIFSLAYQSRTGFLPENYAVVQGGQNGAAIGLGLIAAALICCGSYFLNKLFNGK